MVIATRLVKIWAKQGFAGAALFALSCFGLYADAPATGTIDFRQPANLKMIFDGGLRPYRLQALENSDCDIDRTDLTIILPTASSFNFEADRANFSVLANNDLAGMDIFGTYITVDQAVALTKTICQAAGLSSDGLDQTAATMGTKPGASKGWGQRLRRSGLDLQVTFVPLYFYDHVGAQVCLFIHCGSYPNGMKFLTAPIQPPPGYENVSMKPPPIKPSGRALPGMTWDQARAQAQQQLAQAANPTTPPPPLPPPSPAPRPPAAPEAIDTGIPFWVYVLIGLSVGVIAGAWYFLRKRQ